MFKKKINHVSRKTVGFTKTTYHNSPDLKPTFLSHIFPGRLGLSGFLCKIIIKRNLDGLTP
jgi:hypothetical protein